MRPACYAALFAAYGPAVTLHRSQPIVPTGREPRRRNCRSANGLLDSRESCKDPIGCGTRC
jgi:hypothetical protein